MGEARRKCRRAGKVLTCEKCLLLGLIGDFNAQIGCMRDGWEEVMAPEHSGNLTDGQTVVTDCSTCVQQTS